MRRHSYVGWSAEEQAYLTREWPHKAAIEIWHHLRERHTLSAVRAKAAKLDLKKTSATLSAMNRERWACADCGSTRIVARSSIGVVQR